MATDPHRRARSRGRRLAIALTLTLAAIAHAGDGQPAAAADDTEDVRAVVSEIVSAVPTGPGEADGLAARRLAALGEAGIPALFEALGRASGDFRAPRRRTTLLLAFAHAPRVHAIAYLREAAGPGAPLVDRVTVLEALATIGGPDGLSAVFDMTGEMDSALLRSPAMRSRVRATVGRILSRDREALRVVESAYGTLDRDLAEVALDAVEESDCNEGLLLLTRLLVARKGDALPLLVRIARAPVRGARLPEPTTLFEVDAALESHDPVVRRTACLAAGRLHDARAVERLISLLEDEDRRVVSAAHKALRRLSGQRLGPDSERWTTWLAAEREWVRTESPDALARLHSPDAAIVESALASLGRRRLFRDRVREPIERRLRHSKTSVRAAAARTLAGLRDPRSLEPLMEALGDTHPDVAEAIVATLGDLTGLAHGMDPDAWRSALDIETTW